MKDINDGTVQWSYIIQQGVSKLRDNKPEKTFSPIGCTIFDKSIVIITALTARKLLLFCNQVGGYDGACTVNRNLHCKWRQQSAICWNSLGLFRDYGLDHICFTRQKAETFSICLKKIVKPHKILNHSVHSDSFYFCFFYKLSFRVEIFVRFHEILFQTDSENLEKQKKKS